ncbi:caspase family protein [Micromonospora aurantiaca (nom. illeg.)]|uniref:Tetratricopeptide repeat protein n=1 Tax=Micromonospora aurantiaca (nom. illeg.) TaxID=47850 RepID=A0A6N3K363_9ACTN|nr:caspase family protein [Micromonospora aurantiaca]ADL45334.1 hypothetical protein Micau_1781 [Micromonospora aurantiaca ATCC 27029]AXH91449.1 hypothetical protein DVH21_16785 [Micromonospora aurantiaca]
MRRSTARILLAGRKPDVARIEQVLRDHLPERRSSDRHRLVDGEVTAPRLAQELSWLMSSGTDESLRLFYYSGHATILPSQEVAIVCADSVPENPSTYLSASVLFQFAAGCSAARHVWVLDCCFAEGLGASRLPEPLRSVLHHAVLASSSQRYMTPAADDGAVSPFTALLELAVRGLAYPTANETVDLGSIVEYLLHESSRLGEPAPRYSYAGSGNQLVFVPQSLPMSVLRHTRSRTGAVRTLPLVSVGEPGPLRAGRAVERTDLDDEVRMVDGRTRPILGVSKSITAYRPDATTPILVDSPASPSAWDLVELADHRPVLFTVSSQADIPQSIRDLVTVDVPPPVDERDVLSRLRRHRLPDKVARRLAGDLAERAQGSEYELNRLIRQLRASSIGDGSSAAADELPGVGQTVAQLVAASPYALGVLRICADVPGMHLPLSTLTSWLRSQHAGPGAGHGAGLRSLLAETGLLILRSGSVLLPVRFAGDVLALLPGLGHPGFAAFAAWALGQRGTTARLTPQARHQLLRAALLFCEHRVGDPAAKEDVDMVFQACGLDLFSSATLEDWLPLTEQVVHYLGGDATAGVLSVCAHGYRLADDYDRARRLFQRARTGSRDPLELLAARAGILAMGNYVDGATRTRLDAMSAEVAVELSDLDSAKTAKGSMPLAQLLFRQGNLEVYRAQWDEARTAFERATSFLARLGDITSARLRIDVLKGLGDIAVARGELDRAGEIATTMFRALVRDNLVRLGRPCVAKTLQFAGEIARQRAVSSGLGPVAVRTLREEAAYWYRRAAIEYRDQRLTLGTLMTGFMLSELDGMNGDLAECLERHMEGVDAADRIGSSFMHFKFLVGTVKAGALLGRGGRNTILQPYADELREEVARSQAAPVHLFWGKVALCLLDKAKSDGLRNLEPHAANLRLPQQLRNDLRSGVPGPWLFGYY